jgi:hypothetical protein
MVPASSPTRSPSRDDSLRRLQRRRRPRTGAFRAGGTGDDNAKGTSRRCAPNRRASARTDNPSRSRARRICPYNATFDLVAITHGHDDEHPRWRTLNVGPDQMSTPRTAMMGLAGEMLLLFEDAGGGVAPIEG